MENIFFVMNMRDEALKWSNTEAVSISMDDLFQIFSPHNEQQPSIVRRRGAELCTVRQHGSG